MLNQILPESSRGPRTGVDDFHGYIHTLSA